MEPDILLIDEVLAVGDMGFVSKCFNRIRELMPSTAIIFVSHSMPNVGRICSQIMTLNGGEVIYQGGNTSKGIEKLYSLFSEPRTFEIYSSPEVSLKKVEIESDGKMNVNEISQNGTFQLHFYLDVLPSISDFNANLLILDQNQNPLIFSSSHYSVKSLINDGENIHITADLGVLNLTSGIYYIDVSINDNRNISVYAQVKSIKQFQVLSKYTGYAPIQLPGNWIKE